MPSQNTSSPYALPLASLDWQDDNPESSAYGDIYFSSRDGLEESHYVFLEHNQLQQRFQALDSSRSGHFYIAETGFGTGLNFLATAELWQRFAPNHWQLHFFSVEKHPLTKADLQRALKRWPSLQSHVDELVDNYPELTPGLHRIKLPKSSIQLQLWFGEALDGFRQSLDTLQPQLSCDFGAKVDAWFLDGFAPSKNPAMWSEPLFELITQLSKTGTTFATFTAAGDVRRGLQDKGFSIKKAPGFGKKREMLYGIYNSAPQANISTDQNNAPKKTKSKGVRAPWSLPPKIKRPDKVIVIGGGLAGTSTARALAERGISVTLVERHPKLAQEASGNAQGMLYTKLSPQDGLLNQFTLSSFLYAQRHYKQLLQQGLLNEQQADLCGLLQLACSEKEQSLLAQLSKAFAGQQSLVQFLNAEQASQCAGVSSQYPGYYLPQSGWIAPQALCESLIDHPLINVVVNTQALSLEYQSEHQHQNSIEHWTVEHNAGQETADVVIIANSHDANHITQTATIPLKVIRGQITAIAAQQFAQQPKTVICHQGYLTPAIDNTLRFGATFDNGNTDKTVRQQDHRRNLESLHRSLPALFSQSVDNMMQSQPAGRANLRCTTPDYMPAVGPVHQHSAFITDFAALAKDASLDIQQPGRYYQGLYINVGHGARGLTSTPICAELLAALICNEPRPLPRVMVEALNPARFLVRDIIRGKIAV